MNKIVAIIQARMRSTRLPGKVMLKINGKELLWYQIERIKLAKKISKIIVATTNTINDDVIEQFCLNNGLLYFRGSENNVLDRYYKCALKYNADIIVRITADCPLIDPKYIDRVINYYLNHPDCDIVRTGPSFPEGFDTEVFSLKNLKIAWKYALLKSEREHVTAYFWNNLRRFKTKTLYLRKDYSFLRITVDEKIDFEVIKEILKEIYPKKGINFTLEDILNLRKEKPLLFQKNIHIIRNEGYLKSVQEDQIIIPKMRKRSLVKSNRYWQKAIKIIPSGTQTFSKGPTQYVQGVAPIFLDHGKGCHVWDVDGNEYIDYSMALGPITLGYCYPKIDKAIVKQLNKGITFTLMHPLELQVSEKLIELIPCAEMVRFGKNGSDVTTAAIRLARAYTGRDKIAMCGYHGWHDWSIGKTTRNKGVPKSTQKLTLTFNYNDIDSLKKFFEENPNEIAAVILEAIAIEEPKPGFLEEVKKITHKYGAILIFDEIVNGFRIATAGAQEYYHVVPDLATFGKGMANGMPISALVGKKEIMSELDNLFYSFTFGGEALSLAASLATIEIYEKQNVIKHFVKQGNKLIYGYRKLVKKHKLENITGISGLAAHSAIYFKNVNQYDSLMLKSLFQQEVIKRGILTIGVHNICYTLDNTDVYKTLLAYDEALAILKKAIEQNKVKQYLEGRPIKPIFQRW